MTLEKSVQKTFIKNGLTLALAESCTGGALAATLVSVPDASLYFLGSLVAYANSAKVQLLQVSQETLNLDGAVSEACAIEMARGALKEFGSDVALSVTGVAGPTGGSEEKPVGQVFFALVSKTKEPHTWGVHFVGEREKVVEKCCHEALKKILEYV